MLLLAAALLQPALVLPVHHRPATAARRAPPPSMDGPRDLLGDLLGELRSLSRREALLLLPLTLAGIGGIRYATVEVFPSSLEGPIGMASAADMRGKVAVVTGANTGLGYETALKLADEGATVVLAGRSLAKLNEAAERIRARVPVGVVEVQLLDLASLESVRRFAAAFLERHRTLDVLVNNAGLSAIPERRETADGLEQIFQVNFLGHFLLTNLLTPALRAAAAPRVVNVSSRASFLPSAKLDLADLQHDRGTYDVCQTPVDCPAYAASKLEQLLFARELQRRLGGDDSRAVVVSLHPGLVATSLLRYSTIAGAAGTLAPPPDAFDADHPGATRALNFFGFKTPEQGAQTAIWAATSPTLTARSAGGRFLRECAVAEDEAKLASDLLGLGYRDDALAAGLWREAERLSGADFRPAPMV